MSSFKPLLPKPQQNKKKKKKKKMNPPNSKQESRQERSREAWEVKAPPGSCRGLPHSVAFDGGSARRQLQRRSNFGPPVEGCSRYQGLDRDQQVGWPVEWTTASLFSDQHQNQTTSLIGFAICFLFLSFFHLKAISLSLSLSLSLS